MKSLLTYLLLILVSTTCFSQTEAYFGVRTGATLSNFRGNEDANQNNFGLDYLFGVSGEFPLNEKLSLLININYHRKSAVRKFDKYEFSFLDPGASISDGDIKVKSSILYLSIPIAVKYKFGSTKDYFINAGGFLDFLNNTAAKVNGDKVEDNSRQFFQQMDFGTVLGIGKSFKTNNGNKFTIELRNNLGLINISRIEDSKVLTNSYSLNLEYQFNLSPKALTK
jgi:hypothetical protein